MLKVEDIRAYHANCSSAGGCEGYSEIQYLLSIIDRLVADREAIEKAWEPIEPFVKGEVKVFYDYIWQTLNKDAIKALDGAIRSGK